MNIIILSVYPFPNGFAATNRIISYSKGLIELRNNVINVIVRPTEKKSNNFNTNYKGNYEGIEFYYPNKSCFWSDNYLIKIFQIFYGFISSLIFLIRLKIKNKVDLVVVSIDSLPYDISYSLFVKKILKTKVLFISDEYPFVLRKNKNIYKYFPALIKLVEKFSYRYFDGIIVMTKALRNYFSRTTHNKIPIELILMTVELDRFEKINKLNQNNKYLAYIGDLTSEKDGLDIMIKAFAEIINYFPNYVLKIAGSTKKNEDVENLKKLVEQLNLTNKVLFIGKLKRKEVPEFLINSDLLILSRPYSERAEGGFPTKLGEYLATGNPVIVTSVGEIPDYLEDGKSAFLAEPGSVVSLKNKIIEVLANPLKASQIGKEGKKIAENTFNYKVQAKIMNDFFVRILDGQQ